MNIEDNIQMARTMKRSRIKKQAKRMIYVSFKREGIHCYPAAATDESLATGDKYDVSFLANEHRHIFHITVGIQVFHNDRDIEFIQFKRYLEFSLIDGTMNLNNKSCEMISDDLYDMIATRYPDRDIEITVSEDGENSATIYYNTLKPAQYETI